MASRYMKVGNIASNNRGYLGPNPEPAKKKKQAVTKKATKPASPKKPSPKNKSTLATPKPPTPKPSLAPPKSVPKAPKSEPKKASLKKTQMNFSIANKNAPKYRFNSPSNSVLTANNFEDLYILEGKGESREEFKRKM
jgi:hypothetical protein